MVVEKMIKDGYIILIVDNGQWLVITKLNG